VLLPSKLVTAFLF